jgi:RNA polymerase sigma factor (TIGR02999 family)
MLRPVPDDAPATDEATAEMMAVVYDELRALAGSYFRMQPDSHTLQPTALVHEAFLRLARQDESKFRGKEHFFAVAATAMRQILTSHARKRLADKRGGGAKQVTLSNIVLPDGPSTLDIVELDRVLSELERLNERQARLVEYRFFGGLTLPEIAKVLDVSITTIEKDWRRARAWLAAELGE